MILQAATTPVRLARTTARVIGYRRLALLGTGALIGALVTPIAGPELRRRIAEEIERRRLGTEPTVEDRVRQHLGESPRTWHLTQPEVVAMPADEGLGWQIILAGSVVDEEAREELERAARSVTDVDNRLRVDASLSGGGA
jgi:hypothetical protein